MTSTCEITVEVCSGELFCSVLYLILEFACFNVLFLIFFQEWNAPKPMHPSLLNEALQWAIVSISASDENYSGYD